MRVCWRWCADEDYTHCVLVHTRSRHNSNKLGSMIEMKSAANASASARRAEQTKRILLQNDSECCPNEWERMVEGGGGGWWGTFLASRIRMDASACARL